MSIVVEADVVVDVVSSLFVSIVDVVSVGAEVNGMAV